MENNIDYIFIKTGLGIGGASISDLDLLSVMKRKGFFPTIVTGYMNNYVQSLAKRTSGKIIVDSAFDSKEENLDLAKERFGKIVKEHSPAFILASQFFTPPNSLIYQCILGNGIPVAVRVHDPPYSDQKDPNVDLWIPTTEFNEAAIKDRFSGKYRAIPPLLNYDRYLERQNRKEEIRKHFGIQDGQRLIVQPTRVDLNKRIDRSIILLKGLNDLGMDSKLLVSGGGEDSHVSRNLRVELVNLAEYYQISDKVIFGDSKFACDRIDNGFSIVEVMASADLVTFMPETEGYGLAPLEAAILGVPVVISDYSTKDGEELSKTVYREFDFLRLEDDSEDAVKQLTSKVAMILADKRHCEDMILHNSLMASEKKQRSFVNNLEIALLGII